MSRIPWKRSRLGNLWAQEGNDGTGYRVIIAKDRRNRRPVKPYHLILIRDSDNDDCYETPSYFTTEARAVAAAEERYGGWRWQR